MSNTIEVTVVMKGTETVTTNMKFENTSIKQMNAIGSALLKALLVLNEEQAKAGRF